MRNLLSRLLPLSLVFATGPLTAATLVYNVNGYTMNEGQREQFVAIEYDGAVITAVYTDAEAARSSAADTRIDGEGFTMLPGLIDAHGHVAYLGKALATVSLTGTTSEQEAVDRIADRVQQNPGKEWVTGHGWNQVLWDSRKFPNRVSLDAVTPDRPAYFSRVDGHAAWVNSQALEVAGIDRNTPDPVGGKIIRDANGDATGVLIDNAMDLVSSVMPGDTVESKRQDIVEAMEYLVSLGMTGTHDAGVSAVGVRAYEELAADTAMLMRVYVMLSTTDVALKERIAMGPKRYESEFLSAASVKIVADGALGSRGAALMHDYQDAPGNRGLMLQTEEGLHELMHTAARAGYQVNVHAIGDFANRRVLDEFEQINADDGQRALRHRVEHAQILHPADIKRFEALDVIASVQPTHATSDKNMAGNRLGLERLRGAYAWQTLVESGARLAGGSDFPVEPPDPFYGLHAAVTRRDREGNPLGGWRPKEALNRDQALSLFTEDAAYAGHAEQQVGRLKPGYQADFILVRDDYFAVDAQSIWENEVLMTVVGGAVVYQRTGIASARP